MNKTALVMLMAAVSAAACKSKAADTGAGSGSGSGGIPAVVPVEQTLPKLTVTIDGKTVAMSTAMVKTVPDGRLQLYITPAKVVRCQELLTNVFNEKKVDSVLVDLPSRLGADGKDSYGVGSVYMGEPKDADAGGTATLTGALQKGNKVDLDLAFAATNGRGQKVAVKGTLTADVCGDQPSEQGPGEPKQAHASSAKLTIAGKTFDVKGAIRKGASFELVDYPRACLAAHYLGVRVTLDSGVWKLDGSRFATEQKYDPKAAPAAGSGSGSGSGSAAPAPAFTLAIKPGKEVKAAGSGAESTVELAVSGEGKIGDYDVKLDGTVEAIDCK